jgi:hypothetical protein
MFVRTDIAKKKAELNQMGVKSFPANLGAHATLLIFKKYKYRSPGTRELNRVSSRTLSQEELGGSALLLPLPREIKDSYSVKISEFDQGMFGDAISQGGNYLFADGTIDQNAILANLGVPSTQTMVATATGALGGLATKFLSSRTGGVGGAALGALLPGSSNIASSLEAGAGATVNPKQALSFQGIDLKRHNFSWTLAATSPEESDTIRDITNIIRRNALPSYTNIGPLQRAFLNYPSTVDVYFFGIEQEYFMFYKTCMIDNFDFNYSPQGMAVLRGGKPAMVNVSISLKEMDIHTAEDYGGESTNIAIAQRGGRNEF